ncbi:MAG: hypothetical protein GY870_01810 [archaeon]|nr:hypothetical protein [archaeon]
MALERRRERRDLRRDFNIFRRRKKSGRMKQRRMTEFDMFLIWIVGIVLAYFQFWYILVFVIIGAIIQFLLIMPQLKEENEISFKSVVMSLLFGFSWWVPIKKVNNEQIEGNNENNKK